MAKMKTTFELPDDLLRRIKIRAVHEKRKLKETVAFLLEQGMASAPPVHTASLPKPVTLKKRGSLNVRQIEKAIGEGRS
jgi:hypothetical protein